MKLRPFLFARAHVIVFFRKLLNTKSPSTGQTYKESVVKVWGDGSITVDRKRGQKNDDSTTGA